MSWHTWFAVMRDSAVDVRHRLFSACLRGSRLGVRSALVFLARRKLNRWHGANVAACIGEKHLGWSFSQRLLRFLQSLRLVQLLLAERLLALEESIRTDSVYQLLLQF